MQITNLKVNLVCMEESRTYRTASLIHMTAVPCSGTDIGQRAFQLLSYFCVHEEDGCLYQDGWGQTAAINADTDHACAWIPGSKSISF